MHNHNGGNNKSMMWMMIPCLLLLAFALFGGTGFASSKYIWLLVVGVCVIPHVWMMFRGDHGNEQQVEETEKKDDSSKKGGCCK
jgi:hypothetical protein